MICRRRTLSRPSGLPRTTPSWNSTPGHANPVDQTSWTPPLCTLSFWRAFSESLQAATAHSRVVKSRLHFLFLVKDWVSSPLVALSFIFAVCLFFPRRKYRTASSFCCPIHGRVRSLDPCCRIFYLLICFPQPWVIDNPYVCVCTINKYSTFSFAHDSQLPEYYNLY